MATEAVVAKAPVAPSSRIAIGSLVVLVIVNIVNFYDRHVSGALAEPLRKEFGLNDTQLGWIGTIFTLLYAVIGLPLGSLADRVSRKKLLSTGIALWGSLTAMAAWATTFSLLLVSRLGLAVGEAACAPTAAGPVAATGPVHAGCSCGRSAEFLLQLYYRASLRVAPGDDRGRDSGFAAGASGADVARTRTRGHGKGSAA